MGSIIADLAIAVAVVVGGLALTALCAVLWCFWCGFYQLQRVRAVLRQNGRAPSDHSLRSWSRSVWKRGLHGGDIEVCGVLIPFQALRNVRSAALNDG